MYDQSLRAMYEAEKCKAPISGAGDTARGGAFKNDSGSSQT